MNINTDQLKALLDIIAAVPDIGEKAAREWAIARFSFDLGRTAAQAIDSKTSLTFKVDVDPQLLGVLDAVSTAADAVAASPCDQAAVDAFAEASRNFANACGRHLRDQLRGAPSDLDREAAAVDELLRELGLDPERCRTEGGAVNMGRVRTMLADVAGKAQSLCGQCGHREACEAMGCKRAAPKAEPVAVEALLLDWADAACVRWAARSDGVRTTDTVRREDLRMLVNAARAATPSQPVALPAPDSVHAITTAYEQGVGHALRNELTNPYTPGSDCSLAWDIGRKTGARIQSARAVAQQLQQATDTREGLTVLALSIRQPWAWLILRGGKDIENRDWPTRVRGRVLVHAAKGMTRDEFDSAAIFSFGRTGEAKLPPMGELQRGGIVGSVEIMDCVQRSDSHWFVGRYGFLLRDPQPLPFRPWRGALGFFDVPLTLDQLADGAPIAATPT